MENLISTKERWLGAICYLSVLVFLPISRSHKSPFLVRHCRQGFALFFAEVVGGLLLLIIDVTLGQVPVLGFLILLALRLVYFLICLSLSVLGFTKALFGETWRIPYLDELAQRMPID